MYLANILSLLYSFYMFCSDTEEASESEMGKPEEYTEIREQ